MRRWTTSILTFRGHLGATKCLLASPRAKFIDRRRFSRALHGPEPLQSVQQQNTTSEPKRAQHLLEWANDVEQDTRDQLLYVKEQREAFPEALNLLKAISTGAGHSLQRRETGIQIIDHHPVARPSRSPVHESLTTSQSWLLQKIYFLTRKGNPTQSAAVCRQLKSLFNDSQSESGLSVQAYVIVVAYCLRIYNFKLLRYFMKHSQQHNIVANIALCNTVLGIFVHEKDLLSWTGALQMFANVGIRAETDTWNQFLTLCNRAQKVAALREMTALNIRPDEITKGIMLPIERTTFGTTQAFLQSLEGQSWSGRLGDVLLGELCATKDLRIAVDLLHKPGFRFTIEGIDQLLASVLRTSTDRLNHHKLTRQICRGWVVRGLKARKRTFLLLLRMNRRIKSAAYAQMIESTAFAQGLESFAFKKELVSLSGSQNDGTPKGKTWDWATWLQRP